MNTATSHPNAHVVIMAGGIGSRFWPMSTPAYPKQFIDVLGVGKSLIQLTAERFAPVCPSSNVWVVTSEKYLDIVKEQLPQIPVGNILTEPAARNTAPCIAYASWKIKAQDPDANIVVTPSDALVLDTHTFVDVIQKALTFTETEDVIATISIKPSRPDTGYGYINCSQEKATEEIFKVAAFKEKPNLETAKAYLADGNYFWNAGIFVWNVRAIEKALRTYAPGIASIMDEMAKSFGTAAESDSVKQLFPTCEKISIDYAVMEKAPNIYTYPTDFGWSDLGSWGSLHKVLDKDAEGNAVVGNKVKLYNCKNCVVHVSEEKAAVLEGLENHIVAEKDGRLLVCRLSEEQRIKEFSEGC